jgi:hypothetical protein
MTRDNLKGWLVCSLCGLFAGPARAAVYVPENRLWPDGVVPFEWHANISFANRLRVIAAMNIWREVANVEFVLRAGETDYVLIQDAPGTAGSSSPTIGRGGGVQNLFIRQDLSGITNYGLAHELGHVLGYYHTHQRPDRDTFVTVYDERMNDCQAGNFTLESNALGYPRNQMDYDSVMSYGQCIFSNCGLTFDEDCGCGDDNCNRWASNDCSLAGVVCCSEDPDSCRVIEINDPDDFDDWQGALGQRSHLSAIDAMVMSFMYPEANWRFLELNYPGSSESGTFHNPYRTLSNAVTSAPAGTVLWVQPATYAAPAGALTKPMVLRAPLGGVLIR